MLSMLVKLVPYDPLWPQQYEAERCFILEAVGEKILSIDHIGSTSVPGLGAKAIIDIIVGVADKKAADEIIEAIRPLGYVHKSRGENENPDWFYCVCRIAGEIRFHLHLVKYNSDFHLKHIIFRDWLRAHPEDARKYYELKQDLAEKYGHDMVVYANAKTDFIRSVVEKAKKTKLSEYDDPKS